MSTIAFKDVSTNIVPNYDELHVHTYKNPIKYLHNILNNILKDVDKEVMMSILLGPNKACYCSECGVPFNSTSPEAECPECKSSTNVGLLTGEIASQLISQLRDKFNRITRGENGPVLALAA